MIPTLADAIPTHLRDFETRAIFLQTTSQIETNHFTWHQAKARCIAFSAYIEQHLLADTHAKQGFITRGIKHSNVPNAPYRGARGDTALVMRSSAGAPMLVVREARA